MTADGPPVVIRTRLAIKFYILSTAATASPTYFPFPFQKIAVNFKSNEGSAMCKGQNFS